MKKIKTDLHNHFRTPSTMKEFDKTINVINKKLGSGSIVGLVNFNDNRYENFSNLQGYERENLGNSIYVPEKNVLVIKGQEIPTKQGHLLVLGIPENKSLSINRTLEDSIKEARDYNSIIIADHPFGWEGIGEYLTKKETLLDALDGIEIHNGETVFPNDANKKALNFYKKIYREHPHLSAISTSDGHSLREIGSSYTIIPEIKKIHSKDIIDSLRDNLKNAKRFKTNNSYLGTINHTVQLATIIGLHKLGMYKSEAPEKFK